MAIADDFSIALSGDIRHTSGATTYTVLEMHRYLQDNADNASAASADDLINITSDDPSAKSTAQILQLLPPYNITATEIEFLYDGSIVQGSGATEEKWGGLVVVGNVVAGTELQVIQNDALLTSYWSTGLNAVAAENILLQIMVKIRDAGRDIDARKVLVVAREFGAGGGDTYSEFGLTLGDANATAAIFTSNDLNNDTAVATVNAYDKHDNTEGFQAVDIDPGVSPESYFSQWDITGTGTLPASPTLKSLYEYTKAIGVRGTAKTIHGRNGFLFRGITNEVPYTGQGANPFVENQFVSWGTTMAYDNEAGGPFTIGEKLSFGTSGAVGTLLALQDDVAVGVLVVAIEPGTGTVINNEQITGATSSATADVDGATRLVDTAAVGGEGLILADDDNGATGTIWIQLVKGSAPTTSLPIHGHNRVAYLAAAAVEAAAGTVVAKTVSPTFLGTYTGSALIGAFGQGMTPADSTAADLFFPLEGGTATPPDNRIFTVSGLVVGEDYVCVAKDGAPGFDIFQMAISGTLSSTVTSVTMAASIPNNTPASGTLRLLDDNGTHRLLTYGSFSGAVFSTVGGDNNFTTVNATTANGAYITYIDKLATSTSETFSYVFVNDTPGPLRARARDGGVGKGDTPIKTAEGTAAFSTGSINLNRISDA